MRLLIAVTALGLCGAGVSCAADVAPQRPQTAIAGENSQSTYYWQTRSINGTAQLLTLVCRSCRIGKADNDVPLVSVLRDTLGDNDPENDRVTYVWLLSCAHLNLGQRVLSAVPFFYWRVGGGSRSADDTSPLLDLTAPQHPVLSEIGRDLVQWTTLDPMMMPVRATTRAYRTNATDRERLQLEQAIGYLHQAPVSDDQTALTRKELDTVIARLELRNRLLGGLVSERQAAHIGSEAGFEQERIRSKNWELLRESAERTGLLFEPLNLAGTSDQYGLLWFRLDAAAPSARGVELAPVWKLLNIKNPWNDERIRQLRAQAYTRSVDENGSLVPPDTPGAQRVQLVPLGVYGLNYPKLPLLLVDFRDKLHMRRHEMTQRAINQVTSGVIGISHFTNWYYYVAADLYDFVVSRHGAAMDHAARLDSYSQFRAALSLDRTLDPDLRSDIQKRLNSLDLNPMEARPDRDVEVAMARYKRLQEEASADGRMESRIDKERRAELASFGESRETRAFEMVLHDMTLGFYTHRVSKGDENPVALDRDRRIQYQLSFLDALVESGTQPEVSYDTARIRQSVNELSGLMQQLPAKALRAHAAATLAQLVKISRDPQIESDCSTALAALETPVEPLRASSASERTAGLVSVVRGSSKPVVAASPAAVK